MSNKQLVLDFIADAEIDERSILIGVHDDQEEDSEAVFTSCDITGEDAECFRCSASTKDGKLIFFDASVNLCAGALGKIAGYF